jgi:beta-phosphoglucomutase family hydrolase
VGKFSYDAVIFDLDGVITQTAAIHSRAWKLMFDEFLQEMANKKKEPFKPFDMESDYLNYVDGKPRFKGVESFLKSRNIALPYGKYNDKPVKNTICGLGNRKNVLFKKLLKDSEIEVFETTVDFIKELKSKGIKIGVASSSESCREILSRAGLADLFEVCVDGIVSKKLNLKGKPEPDIFLKTCEMLGVDYKRCVIVEDAVSGVQAGARGGFGLVVGVDRQNKEKYLKANGADLVVKDLGELNVNLLEKFFQDKYENEKWSVFYNNYIPKKESSRESLCTVGNGYFGTRGAIEESKANDINYPGTYIAGVYNKLKTRIKGRLVENEDMVNCPNWLPFTFKIGDSDWIDLNEVEIINFKRTLNIKKGVLFRSVIIKDEKNRETLIESIRTASMADPHIGGIKYSITPLNYSCEITIKSELDGGTINSGVKRYRDLSSRHYDIVKKDSRENISFIHVKTNQSCIEIALAARLSACKNDKKIKPDMINGESKDSVFTSFSVFVPENETISADKVITIYTSKDRYAKNPPLVRCISALKKAGSFDKILYYSEKAWDKIWKETNIKIQGIDRVQKLIRLNIYHLMITVSPHNVNIDGGFPARGLHGEAYRGHIFWDELFVLPFYNIHFPEVSRSILLYRYRRLNAARKNASDKGYKGALYPWQSGSDGSEQSQVIHLNPVSGEWDVDYSALQYHVTLAVALNIWQYYQMTGDIDFIEKYGAEIFFEICRFWVSKAVYNEKTQRYEISGVMGPDEYHEKYPASDKAGLKDNSYTNIMVAWLFRKALIILDILKRNSKTSSLEKINFKESETKRWQEISRRINLVISEDGIISQFDGYFDLKELDWKEYLARSNKIDRIDRLLKAEGLSPDEYKVSKQADVLMAFYNLGEDEVLDIIKEAGYLDCYEARDILKRNFDYYIKRTSHDSTLSLITHSYLAHLIGYEKYSWRLYIKALNNDYNVFLNKTTVGEGIHTGVMAGVIMMTLKCYAGVNFNSEPLSINPRLPHKWEKISFNFILRDNRYDMQVDRNLIKILVSNNVDYIKTIVCGKEYMVPEGKWKEIKLSGEIQPPEV